MLAIATSLALDLHVLHKVVHSMATGYVTIFNQANYSSYSIKNKQRRCTYIKNYNLKKEVVNASQSRD